MFTNSAAQRSKTPAKAGCAGPSGGRRDMAVAAGLILLVTLMTLGWGMIVTARADRRTVEAELQVQATMLARSVDLKLVAYKGALATIAQSTALRVEFDLEAVAVDARRVGELFGGWFVVMAGGDRMEFLLNTRTPEGFLPSPEPRTNYPELMRAEEESLRLGTSVISDAFPGRIAGDLVVAIASPIETARKPAPFLYFAVTLRDITAWLAETDLGDSEFAAIADGSRRVIAVSQDNDGFLLAGLPDWYVDFSATRDTGTVIGTPIGGGEPRLFAMQRLATAPGWTLAVSRPLPSVLSSAIRSALPGISALLVLIVSTVMAVLFLGGRRARAEAARAGREAAEREGLLAEIREADARKSRLMAVLAHDLRTPLVALLGALDLLHEGRSGMGPARLRERMQRDGHGMLQLIDDVLELARLGAGELRLRPEPFHAAALLAEVADLVRPQATRRGTVIKVEAQDLPPLLGDITAIRRVLLNFATNAVKATHGGSIHISVTAGAPRGGARKVIFAVADTGCGIAAEDIPKLFRDFGMLEREGARPEGTGLGLAICRRLAEAMGGKAGVDSKAGEGSRFWLQVTLPDAGLTTAAAAAEATDISAALAGLRVLVAEDHETIRQITVLNLARHGAQVTEAADGAEAVMLADARPFDLILMDMSMPHLDGAQAAARIRQGGGASALARIIGITAHQAPEVAAMLSDLAMDACLPKPLDLRRLATLLTGTAMARPVMAAPTEDFDADTLAHLGSFDDGALLVRTLKGFVREIGETRLNLADLVASGNAAAARNLAHKLAGLCALLGARSLVSELHGFEDLTRTAEPADLHAALDRLAAIMERTSRQAEQLIRQTSHNSDGWANMAEDTAAQSGCQRPDKVA